MKDVNLLTSNGVNVAKSMEIFGDMATYDDTLQVFLTEINGKIENLKSFKETGNMADYAIVVHSLKSDAKYFGFDTLAELAYAQELESKANHVYYIYEHYDELMKETNRIIGLVKSYMSGVSAQPIEDNIAVQTEVVSSKKKILVADDSDIIRSVMTKIFADTYEVLGANDGKEAIELVERYKNDNLVGVLLDLSMPKVDGFEVLEYFQKNELFESIPISIITGNDDAEVDNKAFTYPIIDILKKPFNEANIRNVVERTINRIK